MVSFDSLSIPHLSIVLNYVQSFQDFARIYVLWKAKKSEADQTSLLNQIDLLKFFPTAVWETKLREFIHYASTLGVYDALYFYPSNHLLHKTDTYITALLLLQSLQDKGHHLSFFTKNLLAIVYCIPGYQKCIHDMIKILNIPGSMQTIKRWVELLKNWYRNDWTCHGLKDVILPPICENQNHLNNDKLYNKNFPTEVHYIMETNCSRCKVFFVVNCFLMWQWEVFQCTVMICLWRVRHAWHKHLMKECPEIEMRAELARRLSQSVQTICRGSGTVSLFEHIMEDFVDASEFVDYFKAVWHHRIEPWTTALRSLPLASDESCAAMEFYHNQLKLRLFNEKDPNVYLRADWLIDKLGTKVHSYFWLDEYSEKDDFVRYWKDEWLSGLTAWRKSLKYPDSDVVLDGNFAKVFERGEEGRVHIVRNPGLEFGICDCHFADLGNLCEHVLKVISVFRDRGYTTSSVSMSKYSQALFNMLRCPPHDSLIRDHAVSLAVWVQRQLAAQIDTENN